ncbi:GDP-mannose 4,6-dehydratase [Candidatus Babeliales bacterium]|nr:GDP-mannose 4,6-dehydratase [Candidatus Babeliales bacterium]
MDILITGGAGFIGCNAVQYFALQKHKVFVIDNLSRPTARINLQYMFDNNVSFNFTHIDITNRSLLEDFFKRHAFDAIIHLAGQVAVTSSVQNPRHDFDINAHGTFNLLECIRLYNPNAIFINASTNKVYGKLTDHDVIEEKTCYRYRDYEYSGVTEQQPLDFYSPYGCSKGIADQYTLDYARIYNLKTVSVRQSCIYGPHQFGVEDQGWVAWFIIAFLTNKPITIYGNGKQVRDVLFVSDLIKFYELAINNINKISGQAFNIGGGKTNSLSLLEFFNVLETITGKKVIYSFDTWRPGDQFVFVSDTLKAEKIVEFRPRISYKEGIQKTYNWLLKNSGHVVTSKIKNNKNDINMYLHESRKIC